jgi:hypothetical protein
MRALGPLMVVVAATPATLWIACTGGGSRSACGVDATCKSAACCVMNAHYGAPSARVLPGSIASDPSSGDIVIAGAYSGAADVGAAPLPWDTSSASGLFVARYDPQGRARWVKGMTRRT